jgi:hypothetical protein
MGVNLEQDEHVWDLFDLAAPREPIASLLDKQLAVRNSESHNIGPRDGFFASKGDLLTRHHDWAERNASFKTRERVREKL